MNTREIVRQYIDQGISVVPIPAREKGPIDLDWQKRTYTAEHFQDDNNIGAKLGRVSGGLIDVDLDCLLALELAREFLPATGRSFGRKSKPQSHWLYRCKQPGRTRQWKDANGQMIVELRSESEKGTPVQTVFPGSIHESGERVEWCTQGEPGEVEYDVLVQACADLAAAVRVSQGDPPAPSPAPSAPTPPSRPTISADMEGAHEKLLQRATSYVDMAKSAHGPSAGKSGGRNPQAFSLAGHLASFDQGGVKLTEAEILELMRTRWNPRNKPPLDEGELASCVHSAMVNGTRRQDHPGLAVSAVPTDWPDPRPLPNELPPVMPFDYALLPDAFRPWIKDIADRTQCPPDFPATGAMVALAGVVGRKVGIRPKRQDDWMVVPNLWGASIGRPGIMKTPALRQPLRPLERLEIEAKKEYDRAAKEHEAAKLVAEITRKSRESEIRAAVKENGDALGIAKDILSEETPPPVRRRYLVNDSTVEKLGEILNENPNGVTVYRDELIGLLRSLEREGQEGARAFYLEAWDGAGRFTYDRIGRGTIDIEATTVSLIGGIQPGRLAEYMLSAIKGGEDDDGLLQRFQLAVWPDVNKVWRNVDRWPDTLAKNHAFEVFTRLNSLNASAIGAEQEDGIPFLRFTDEAQEIFDEWRAKLEQKVRGGEEHPAMESHLAKYRSLIPSLALLIHLADGKIGPVGVGAVRQAIGWGEYLESHARRIYSMAADPDLAAGKALSIRIQRGEVPDTFALRDVYRNGWSGLSDRDDAERAVSLLLDLDWLRETTEVTPGRDKKRYHVNPKVVKHAPQ